MAIPGTDIRPVVFDGLTVTPWVDDKPCRPSGAGERHRCRARVVSSLRVREMKPVTIKATPAKTSAAAAA